MDLLGKLGSPERVDNGRIELAALSNKIIPFA